MMQRSEIIKHAFLLTDLIRSAAVKAGGALTGGAVVVCPPWGDGSCEVEATSPTATQVEQEREAWSSRGWSSRYPDRCTELRANSDTAHRWDNWWGVSSGEGSWLMSLVLKLFCNPNAEDSAAQLLIRSFSSSNHRISGMSAGLKHNKCFRAALLNSNRRHPDVFQFSQ